MSPLTIGLVVVIVLLIGGGIWLALQLRDAREAAAEFPGPTRGGDLLGAFRSIAPMLGLPV